MAVRTYYVDPAATGTGDGSSFTNAYTSLNACEGARAADLVTATDTMVINCRTSGANPADTTAVTFDGSVTSATYNITVQVAQADRAEGKVDTSKYRLVVDVGWGNVVTVSDLYVTIIGVQAVNTSVGVGRVCFRAAVNYVTFIGCIAYGQTEAGNNGGFQSLDDIVGCVFINCLAMYCVAAGFNCRSASDRYYNCVSIANTGHGYELNGYKTFVGANCYAGGNTDTDCNDSEGNTTFTLTTCASEDGTFGSTIAYSTSSGAYFTNVTAGTEDVHIGASSSFIGAGTDESGVFTTDIDGDTITTWMIGCDFYVAAGGGASLQKYASYYNRKRSS